MLCSTCATIDLSAYFVRETHAVRDNRTIGPSPEAFKLGTLPEVYARYSTCTFCRLVFDAITHRGARNEWLSTEWLLDKSRKLGSEAQCVIYSYVFARCVSGSVEGESLELQDGNRIAIALWPKDKWLGEMSKAGEIALVDTGGEECGNPILFSGRLLNPDRVDVKLARRWLRTCQYDHGRACEVPANDAKTAVPDLQPQNLIVIDVQNLRLCPLPEGQPYIALSYCWPYGAESTFQTRKAVYKDLLVPGALRSRMMDLAPVVRDSILFVQELEERFLWVDALCIVQDDLEFKMDQIRQMDLVYGAAMVTLICADPRPGTGFRHEKARTLEPVEELFPDLGLTGYQSGTRLCPQIRAKVGSLTLTVPFTAIDTSIKYSRWITRAWTFQERSLARRKLYFTDMQLYFQCSCAVFAEDTVGEGSMHHSFNQVNTTLYNSGDTSAPPDSQEGVVWVSRSPPEDHDEAIQTYRGLHYQYCYRSMTHPGDILFAFQGVISILKRTLETEFLAGLPERYFHEALLWVTTGEFDLRSIKQADGGRSFPYPSWTWAGWKSESLYIENFTGGTSLVGLAEWFVDNKEAAWKLRIPAMNEKTNEKWGKKVETIGPGPIPHGVRERLQARDQLVLDAMIWDPSLHLATWSTIAQFRISNQSYDLNGYGAVALEECNNIVIFNHEGNKAGSIILRWEAIKYLLKEGDVHDFVLLSRSHQLTKSITFFDEDKFPRRDWCYINVMLIAEGRERGTGSAGRFGVGVIHEDAWVAARPQPHYIRLQ